MSFQIQAMIKVTSWAWSPILPIKPANSEQLQQLIVKTMDFVHALRTSIAYLDLIYIIILYIVLVTHQLYTYIIVYMHVLQYYSEGRYSHAYTNS